MLNFLNLQDNCTLIWWRSVLTLPFYVYLRDLRVLRKGLPETRRFPRRRIEKDKSTYPFEGAGEVSCHLRLLVGIFFK